MQTGSHGIGKKTASSLAATRSLFYSFKSTDEKYRIYHSALMEATSSSKIKLTRIPETIKPQPWPT